MPGIARMIERSSTMRCVLPVTPGEEAGVAAADLDVQAGLGG